MLLTPLAGRTIFAPVGILDIFSKRSKPLPDVYTYDLPQKLRMQIVHILRDDIGHHHNRDYWQEIASSIAREHGIERLPSDQGYSLYDRHDYLHDCLNYLLNATPSEAVDLIEHVTRFVDFVLRDERSHWKDRSADAIVAELNHRFRENGCGYQYENGKIVRVDSHVVHAEVVKPALVLVSERGFEGPNGEYRTAHEHYRHGRIEEAITEACKAFESTIKAICDARGWPYEKTATASGLVKVLISNGLVEAHNESGLIYVATIRNKLSGHGAGAKPRDVSDEQAAHAIHLAAANIVLLVKRHKALK
jgi:AbiJ N-terminal domain 4